MGRKIVGAAVIAGVVALVLRALWAAAPEAVVLTVWGAGGIWLWWAVSRPLPDTANPAPPPEEDPSPEEKPQFSIVQDPNNPARHIVIAHDRKDPG